jgi:hypothetical protein
MPAQPLLGAPARVDESVAVINKQLHFTKDLLTEPWPAQVRFPQRRHRPDRRTSLRLRSLIRRPLRLARWVFRARR